MLHLGKIEQTIKVDFSNDESYQIKYVTDEYLRQKASEHNIDLKSVVTTFFSLLNNRDSDDITQADDVKLFSILQDAVQNNQFVIDIACESCQGWEGIIDQKDNPLECTDNNKRMIFEKFSARALFIYRHCRVEKLFINYRLEDDIKN